MDKVKYWLDMADEDILTVRCLIDGERFLPAAFFSHLIAEKALKAAVQQNTGETPPKIHGLEKLSKIANVFDDLSEKQLVFLDSLMLYQVEGRYKEHKDKIAKTLTKEKCRNILKETEEFLCWIKEKLEKSH